MSIVVINAVTVSGEGAAEFEERFAKRAGTVSSAPGFEAFELLRPLGDGRYLVYTRWASEEDFAAWMRSGQFSAAHTQHAERPPLDATSEIWRFEVLDAEYGQAPSAND
jgi:heme oxygenase (mycobilin-producing)